MANRVSFGRYQLPGAAPALVPAASRNRHHGPRHWMRLLLGCLAVLLVPLRAAAADHPQEALKLILKQDAARGKATLTWVTKNPSLVLPAVPPTSVGGTLAVTGIDGRVEARLPGRRWQLNRSGTQYKFLNKLAPGGTSPVKVSVLKAGKVLNVVVRDSLIQLDDPHQGTIAIALTIGSDTYCSVCTTPERDEPGKFVAKLCAAPVDCSMAADPSYICGDTVCDPTEGCASCPQDCGVCPAECGDLVCASTEDCTVCPLDCGPCPDWCGDLRCGPTERCASCPEDCGPCVDLCGNGVCEETEGCSSCPLDCGVCASECGDKLCEDGENCISCPLDCGECPMVCGDDLCIGDETCTTCPEDCGECAAGLSERLDSRQATTSTVLAETTSPPKHPCDYNAEQAKATESNRSLCDQYATDFKEAADEGKYRIPATLLRAVAYHESKCDRTAENKDDGACLAGSKANAKCVVECRQSVCQGDVCVEGKDKGARCTVETETQCPGSRCVGGCGIMQLTGSTRTKIAELLGVAPEKLCETTPEGAKWNIRAGASILTEPASGKVCFADTDYGCSTDWQLTQEEQFTTKETDKLNTTFEPWWQPLVGYNGTGDDYKLSTSNYPFRVWEDVPKVILPGSTMFKPSYPPLRAGTTAYCSWGARKPDNEVGTCNKDGVCVASSNRGAPCTEHAQCVPGEVEFGQGEAKLDKTCPQLSDFRNADIPDCGTTDPRIRWVRRSFNFFEEVKLHTNEGGDYCWASCGTRDLVVEARFPMPSWIPAGSNLKVDYEVKNVGSGPVTETYVEWFYLSADATPDPADVLISKSPPHSAHLGAGASVSLSQVVTIPRSIPPANRYLLIVADATNAVAESDESNNVSSSAIPLITPPSGADLLIDGLGTSVSVVPPGGSLKVSYRVVNRGGETVSQDYYEKVWLSANTTLDGADILLATTPIHTQDLAPNGSLSVVQPLTIPATEAGYRYLIVIADAGGAVTETNESNNQKAYPITIAVGGLPNLPAPTLLSPSNGATDVTVQPTLSWSPVSGATSYRVMIATTRSALPTGAEAYECPECILPDVTPTGTSFPLSAGTLAEGTQYWWQVKARNRDQYGAWSAPALFTTAGGSADCGNGIPEPPGEQCDLGSAVNGTPGSCCTLSCQYRGAGQTCRPPTAGCDPLETCTGSSPDCPPNVNNCGGRYIDNGDGTITDTQTGLQWEKKTTAVGSGQNYNDPHDVDNYYTWSTGAPWNQDGTAFTDFLFKLNTVPCFAGHCDWRLPKSGGWPEGGHPSGEPAELESILLAPYPCGTIPCIDSVFGPTAAGFYWSSTTSAHGPYNAWYVYFGYGYVSFDFKGSTFYVRAVRGGS